MQTIIARTCTLLQFITEYVFLVVSVVRAASAAGCAREYEENAEREAVGASWWCGGEARGGERKKIAGHEIRRKGRRTGGGWPLVDAHEAAHGTQY